MSTGNRRGKPRIDDSGLYSEETVNVGLIIFPHATCRICGRRLPRNADYFTPNARAPHGLKTACKACVRERYRDAGRQAAQARRDAVKAARCAS